MNLVPSVFIVSCVFYVFIVPSVRSNNDNNLTNRMDKYGNRDNRDNRDIVFRVRDPNTTPVSNHFPPVLIAHLGDEDCFKVPGRRRATPNYNLFCYNFYYFLVLAFHQKEWYNPFCFVWKCYNFRGDA